MPQQVNVPGVGTLQFPDGMPQADMAAAIQKNYPQIHKQETPATSAEPDFLDHALNVLKGAGGAVAAPLEAGANMATGAAGKVAGDVAGLGTVAGGMLGMTNADPGDVKNSVQNAMTYQPRTQMGQDTVNTIGDLANRTIGAVGRGAGGLADRGMQAVGVPASVSQPLSAGVTEAVNQAPALLGTRLPGVGAGRVAAAAEAAPDLVTAARNFTSARKDGFSIPATEATNAPLGKGVLTGVAGADQVNQAFTHANQIRVDQLAKADIGVSPNTPLADGIDAATEAANAKYAAIRSADQNQIPVKSPNGIMSKGPDGSVLTKAAGPIQMDDAYKAAIDKVGDFVKNEDTGEALKGDAAALQKQYADIGSLSSDNAVKAMIRLRAQARTNFKAFDSVDKQDLAHVQQGIANAIEGRLGSYLQETGQGKLYEDFTQGRQQLAKINDITKTMDGDNVNATKVAQLQKKNGNLTGGLAAIADAATNFPSVVRGSKGVKKPAGLSAFNYAMMLPGVGADLAGGTHGAATGVAAGLLAARPAARALMGSKFYQNQLTNQVPVAGSLSRLAANPSSPLAGLLVNPDDQQP